jgi:N-acetylglutamate synthase-like GNAT family acetyltransferase
MGALTSCAVRAARSTELEAVLALARDAELLEVGVAESFGDFLVAEYQGDLVGAAGLELHAGAALLRTVVVAAHHRSRSVGQKLVEACLSRARERGVGRVYLLTTTAPEFFAKLGFEITPRTQAPAPIRESWEFRAVSPAPPWYFPAMQFRPWFVATFCGAFLLAGCACPPPPATPAEPPPVTTAPPASTEPTTPTPSKEGPEGALCGGIAGFGCAPKLYCAFPIEAHCGAADQSGVCKPIPEVCTEQYAPVCGCNDKTYPNECAAAREGISVGRAGECAVAAPPALAEGAVCGTRGVAGECAEGHYCKYKTQCGATDAGGVCTPRPQMCTKIYKPVCGCDGKTHPNECVAASAGAAVLHDGACK